MLHNIATRKNKEIEEKMNDHDSFVGDDKIILLDVCIPVEIAAKDDSKQSVLNKLECED